MSYKQFRFEFNIYSLCHADEVTSFLIEHYRIHKMLSIGDILNMTVDKKSTFLKVKDFYRKYKSNSADYEQYVKNRVLKRKLSRDLKNNNKVEKRLKI